MRMRLLIALLLPLLLSACAIPQQSGGGRACIQDSGFCYFPGDADAPVDPYRRR